LNREIILPYGPEKNSPHFVPQNGKHSAVSVSAAIPSDFCSEQMHMTDNLCRRSNELDAILNRVQRAIAANKPGELVRLREQFNKVRDQIVTDVQRLARKRRLEHSC
jgi:hypothetical protein